MHAGETLARAAAAVGLVALMLATLAAPAAPPARADGAPTYIEWKAEDGPHVINRSIEIGVGEVLRIGPGVVVKLDKDAGIQVKGTLLVEGTHDAPVLFQPNSTLPVEPKMWAEVRLHALSAGNEHSVSWATFRGADFGLSVASSRAMVAHCTFDKCRYGLVARGDAWAGVSDSVFRNCSVLGAQWEDGSGGYARRCDFIDQRGGPGVYCNDRSSPDIRECNFTGNYHHVSCSQNSSATVAACKMVGSLAEAIECYWNATPLFEDVAVTGSKSNDLYLRNGSHPRFVGGTPPLSTWDVTSTGSDSWAIAGRWVTVEVVDLRGRPLEGANVTLAGASGDVLARAVTDGTGRAARVFMALYTMVPKGTGDLENPQRATVTWGNATEGFTVTARDLTHDGVLVLAMDLSPPEPADGGRWAMYALLVVVFVLVIVAIGAYIILRSGHAKAAGPRRRGRGGAKGGGRGGAKGEGRGGGRSGDRGGRQMSK